MKFCEFAFSKSGDNVLKGHSDLPLSPACRQTGQTGFTDYADFVHQQAADFN
jgi:hypothetical protein